MELNIEIIFKVHYENCTKTFRYYFNILSNYIRKKKSFYCIIKQKEKLDDSACFNDPNIYEY